MKVEILSREYPPKVYGGAGVHAEELCKVLAERVDVTVRAFDGPRAENEIPEIPGDNPKGSLKVIGYDVPKELQEANGALKTFGVDLQIANDVDADIIHAHTWYTCLAGYLAKMLHGTPLVITAHSLEPFRPWKREQLGGGYNLSSWAEKDAYEHADRIIAVSGGMREDILAAYPNVDPNKVVVASIAPAVRVGIGEYFNMPAGENLAGKLVAALLHRLHKALAVAQLPDLHPVAHQGAEALAAEFSPGAALERPAAGIHIVEAAEGFFNAPPAQKCISWAGETTVVSSSTLVK